MEKTTMPMPVSGSPCAWLRVLAVIATISFACWSPQSRADLSTLDKPADREEMLRLETEYGRRIDADRNDAGLYLKRGEVRFKLHDFDNAIEDFGRAIKLDSRLDDAYFARGMALARDGRIDEGIADLDVYIQRHPESSLAYTKRGVRYIWKRDLNRAEKDLTRAIALDAGNAEAHDDLGVILAQHGDYPAAADHFLTTIALDPSYQKAYHNLAMVYYITDHNQDALATIDKSLKLDPQSRDSLLLKASILEALGRHAEAGKIKEDAEFLAPGNPTERSAIQ
jgi:tetratricopeptide (TPR) repeat protein